MTKNNADIYYYYSTNYTLYFCITFCPSGATTARYNGRANNRWQWTKGTTSSRQQTNYTVEPMHIIMVIVCKLHVSLLYYTIMYSKNEKHRPDFKIPTTISQQAYVRTIPNHNYRIASNNVRGHLKFFHLFRKCEPTGHYLHSKKQDYCRSKN